jgi:hypothetical protein
VESFANIRCLIDSSIPRGRAVYPTWQYTKLVSVNCSLNDDPVLPHELVTSKRACHARLEKMKAGVPASHARKRPIFRHRSDPHGPLVGHSWPNVINVLPKPDQRLILLT